MSETLRMTPHAPAASNSRLYLQLMMVSVIWGGTFIAGRLLTGIPPLMAASLRFLIASGGLLTFLGLSRTPLARLSVRQGAQALALGFFGIFIYNICFFYGLHYVTASRASLIVALNPAMIALTCYLIFRESLSPTRIVGVVFCVLGAALVISGRDGNALRNTQGSLPGELLILGCVGSWVIYSVFSRSLSQSIGPLQTVTYSVLAGTMLLCVTTVLRGEISVTALGRVDLQQWLGLLYLGALGSALAYIWYYDGIQKIGATRAGVFIALNPITAVLCGALWLGEPLRVQVGIGGILAVAGIVLSNQFGGGSGK